MRPMQTTSERTPQLPIDVFRSHIGPSTAATMSMSSLFSGRVVVRCSHCGCAQHLSMGVHIEGSASFLMDPSEAGHRKRKREARDDCGFSMIASGRVVTTKTSSCRMSDASSGASGTAPTTGTIDNAARIHVDHSGGTSGTNAGNIDMPPPPIRRSIAQSHMRRCRCKVARGRPVTRAYALATWIPALVPERPVLGAGSMGSS